MTLTTRQRRIGLGCALALTIVVTAVLGDNESLRSDPPAIVTAVVQPNAPSSGIEPPTTLITLDKLNRTPPATEGVDLFASKSWYAPPPPAIQAKPAPPPKPTAPPLPYSYVGQLEGKDGFTVFLARGNDLLSVKPGESLDADYRVETVTPEQITIVYVPLGERQTLVTGGK